MRSQYKKTVIFENIGYGSLLFVFYYLIKKYRIICFNVDAGLRNTRVLKNLFADGRIEKVAHRGSDLEKVYLPHKKALDDIEAVYEHFSRKSKLISLMVRLLKSEMAHAVYKKILVKRLYDFYITHLYVNEFAGNHKTFGEVHFVPQDYFSIRKLLKQANQEVSCDPNIYIPAWSYFMDFMSKAALKAMYIVYLISLLVRLLLKKRKFIDNEAGPKEYQVGIRIYTSDIGFYYKYRRIDFLLDGEKLNADNSLFCIETPVSNEYFRELKENKYNVVEISRILENMDRGFYQRVLLKTFVPYWSRLFVRSFMEESSVIKTTVQILYAYIMWKRFLELYHFKNYVVYNDYSALPTVRNILFAQKGIRTWYYIHSCNDTGVMAPSNNSHFRDFAYSFMNFDTLLVWGDRMKRYQSSHDGYIREYKDMGCLWSEHVRGVVEKNNGTQLKNSVIKKLNKTPKKIIGVFDTSFGGPENMIKSKEMALFFKGIIDLLENNPGFAVVLKNKWIWNDLIARSPDARTVYKEINAHPRCYAINDGFEDPNEVIAISDLVISVCFTAPTVEALGARKKAIYYDATNIFKGYFYDKFPNLVAHSSQELQKTVDYWLNLTDQEFNDYLETYVKGEIDGFVDGKAITRFRQELCKERP